MASTGFAGLSKTLANASSSFPCRRVESSKVVAVVVVLPVLVVAVALRVPVLTVH